MKWIKVKRKLMNIGELKEESVELFEKLMEMGEKVRSGFGFLDWWEGLEEADAIVLSR